MGAPWCQRPRTGLLPSLLGKWYDHFMTPELTVCGGHLSFPRSRLSLAASRAFSWPRLGESPLPTGSLASWGSSNRVTLSRGEKTLGTKYVHGQGAGQSRTCRPGRGSLVQAPCLTSCVCFGGVSVPLYLFPYSPLSPLSQLSYLPLLVQNGCPRPCNVTHFLRGGLGWPRPSLQARQLATSLGPV